MQTSKPSGAIKIVLSEKVFNFRCRCMNMKIVTERLWFSIISVADLTNKTQIWPSSNLQRWSWRQGCIKSTLCNTFPYIHAWSHLRTPIKWTHKSKQSRLGSWKQKASLNIASLDVGRSRLLPHRKRSSASWWLSRRRKAQASTAPILLFKTHKQITK